MKKSSMREFCLLILFLTAHCVVRASEPTGKTERQPVNINAGFEVTDLAGNVFAYSTADSSEDIGKILTKRAKFKLVAEAIPDLGGQNKYHWLRFDLTNETTQDQKLVSFLQFIELENVCFYVVDDDIRIVTRWENFGQNTKIFDKPLLTRFFAFPFEAKPGQRLTVYWRIHKELTYLVFPFRLYSADQFALYSVVYDFFGYTSVAILSLTFLVSLILYFLSKQKVLFYYAGYCLFYVLLCLSNQGFYSQYLYLDTDFPVEHLRGIVVNLCLFFLLKFSVIFLQTNQYAPKWVDRASETLSYFAVLMAVYFIFVPPGFLSNGILNAVFLLGVCLLLVMIFVGIFKKRREAFVYLIAGGPFFLTSLWLALSVLTGLKMTWFFYQTIPADHRDCNSGCRTWL
jgi:hypothetical protein